MAAKRRILFPVDSAVRAQFTPTPPDCWFSGDYLILLVSPNEYQRIEDRPQQGVSFLDTGHGTVAPEWTARVGFSVVYRDGNIDKEMLIKQSLTTSGRANITLLDYVRPELSDRLNQTKQEGAFTARVGRVERIEPIGGFGHVEDREQLIGGGFALTFKEQTRRVIYW